MRVLTLCLASLGIATAFTPATTSTRALLNSGTAFNPSVASTSSSLSALPDPDHFASSLEIAANIRDVTIFKGKTLSLLHPAMMFGMLGFSVSTALLGFNWRRQRTLGNEISDLKKTLPGMGSASSLAEAIATAKEADDTALIAKYEAATSIEAEINGLAAERKQLASENPRDQHFSQGATLAFLGTFFAIEGPLNTYARAGKLFPGPHLYAGAGLVILWAMAVSTVPKMQKGDETARTIHIGANLAGLGLFGWQVVSGVPILLKVWEKAPWP
mmetsp:Transcript_13005/g.19140  ORF Transcript_13005/g.19140 Transcript_13005/m.19140 type:complete len:273 (-) Transcript_13005:329-1147(-)|eukprot:CAMPEP_0194229116 /NCGR_PEP_ID=MMETSP0156-20130528/43725_1 /TAXON_ID=33649 /ORGANISM="Thalassionema nitzschioides, Strain L26-B" /LENGTH=272 /DNA_ID=CAMNT_0038961655 /DNA_START=313 /DNA_END=1131 /DNA_ORIENTATION=+